MVLSIPMGPPPDTRHPSDIAVGFPERSWQKEGLPKEIQDKLSSIYKSLDSAFKDLRNQRTAFTHGKVGDIEKLSPGEIVKLQQCLQEQLRQIEGLGLTKEQLKTYHLDNVCNALKTMGTELSVAAQLHSNPQSVTDIAERATVYDRVREIGQEQGRLTAERNAPIVAQGGKPPSRNADLPPELETERRHYAHILDENGRLAHSQITRYPDPTPNGQSPHGQAARPGSRIPGFAGAAAVAVIAGGAAGTANAATGRPVTETARAAVVTMLHAAAEQAPFIGGRLARNPYEAAIRDAVDVWGMRGFFAGAVVGGAPASIVPGAGTAAGAAGGSVLGNLLSTMAADEILRFHARYIQGQRDNVEPAAGERIIMAALALGAISRETLTAYVQRAAQTVNETTAAQSLSRSKSFNPVANGQDHPRWIPDDFKPFPDEARPLQPSPGLTAQEPPTNAQALIEQLVRDPAGSAPAQSLPSLAETLPPLTLNFNMGPLPMDRYVGQLQEGQPIPQELRFGITALGREFVTFLQESMGGMDIRRTQEFAPYLDPNGEVNPARVGALLFAASLERDASGRLQFDNQCRPEDLRKLVTDRDRMEAIARNVEQAGLFSESVNLPQQQQLPRPREQGIDVLEPTGSLSYLTANQPAGGRLFTK